MILFAADIHLRIDNPARAAVFIAFLNTQARRADALYLLGDIFDVWLGDDENHPIARDVRDALLLLTQAGVAVFIQRGNRDFLIGRRFCQQTGCALLPEWHNLATEHFKILLTHGDLLCGQKPYLFYRRIIQSAAVRWLMNTLPRRWRQFIGRSLRGVSHRQRHYPTINLSAAAMMMKRRDCSILIHGHTHQPAHQTWQADGYSLQRYCLPDWERAPGFIQINNNNIKQLAVTDTN